jgi:RNase P/RNase MRP subunit p30
MTRNFVDSLHPKSESQLSVCLDLVCYLGFSSVWVSNLTKETKELVIQSYPPEIIKIYERLDIGANQESKRDMISLLRRKRRFFPIIAITCLNPELAAWAAQDNRVDILKFPLLQIGKLMTRSIAKLMVKFQKHLEIPLAELYSLPERWQIPAIRGIRSALDIAAQKAVLIIFNSGSISPDQIHSPRELASLGQILLSNSTLPLDSISSIPNQLLEQNLTKISSNYIVPGVVRVSKSLVFQENEEE